MTIATTDAAALAAAFGPAAIGRMTDPAARALAQATVTAVRAERIADAASRAETQDAARRHYAPQDAARIETLMRHVWPRASRIRSAVHAADAAARIAHRDKNRDGLYEAVLRAHRLSVLSALVDAQSRRVGYFPISSADMRLETSRFMRTAYKRRFLFRGGRDAMSSEHSDADVVQGAFIRALDAGDALFGVPIFGTMFRYVQAERAHLTRIAGAEWRGIQDALHGVKSLVSDHPDADDKHSIRRLGTHDAFGRPFGTVETHRAALAAAHVDAERENIAASVTADARSVAILAADERSFARILADVLMRGASLDDIAASLGLNVDTITARALAERTAAMSTGIDHSEDDDPDAAHRDYWVDRRQAIHAERMRARRALAERALYVANRRAGVVVKVASA